MSATPYAPIRMSAPWMEHGLCLQTYNPVFFPKEAGVPEKAKKICDACPVTEECLSWARSTRQPEGIWGGVRFGNTNVGKKKKVGDDG